MTMNDYTSPLTFIRYSQYWFHRFRYVEQGKYWSNQPRQRLATTKVGSAKDKNGNDVSTPVSNVAILEKEAVVTETLNCLIKYGLSKEFEITYNVLETS